MESENREFDWFDKPRVRRGLMKGLWVVCILTIVLQFTPPDRDYHGHFGEPWWVPSYAILGFAACVAMILTAKLLGFVLKKKDTYWCVGEEETLPEDVDESIR